MKTLVRLIFLATKSSRVIRIPTLDDNEAEPNGRITLSIISPSGRYLQYTLSANNSENSASVTILDNDGPKENILPVVTLSSNNSSIVEGVTATITLTSNQIVPTAGLVVSYQKSQTGDFFATSFVGNDTGTILTGETTKDINFVTHDDNIDEPDGSFTITLNSSINYTIGSTSSVTVNVTDNDDSLPVFSITPVANSVEEASSAQFRLTSTIASPSAITVRINVSQTGNVLSGATGDTTIEVDANSLEKIVEIATESDLLSEPDGVITVSLLADDNSTATYEINSNVASQSARVTVTDDEPLPEFGIAGTTAAVLEPDPARFRLWTSTASSTPVSVRIDVSQTGNVLSGVAGVTTTIMPAEERQTYFEIATEDDEVAEANGSIIVTLLADNNSPATYTLSTRTYRQSATVEVYDDDTTPTITIADATAVVEGTDANAVFTITTSHAVRDTRAVNFSVSGATNFIPSDQIPTSITLTRYSLRTALSIPIENDEIDELDGIITITISAPTNSEDYQIGTSSSGQVSVRDDDESQGPPVVSLSTSTPTITEGESAKILFSLDRAAPINGLIVGYSIVETHKHLNSYVAGINQLFIPAGEISKELSLHADSDWVHEPDGSFTISLNSDTSYSLGEDSIITVDVTDNNYVPEISMTRALAVYENNGAVAEFVLESSIGFFGTKMINVSVEGVTSFIAGRDIPTAVAMEGTYARMPKKKW